MAPIVRQQTVSTGMWTLARPIMIAQRSDGSDLVLAGQKKSGDVWALNPDTGELIWNTKVGPGGAIEAFTGPWLMTVKKFTPPTT